MWCRPELSGSNKAVAVRELRHLHFDYRLKDGPSSTRNVIALLRLMQYPGAIIGNALASAERLEHGAMSRVDRIS